MESNLQVHPAIICHIPASIDIAHAVKSIEAKEPAIRASQRFRSLIADSINIEIINRSFTDYNLFTAVVVNNIYSLQGDDCIEQLVSNLSKYQKKIRFYICCSPEYQDYSLSSRLHVMLQGKGIGHEFRSANSLRAFNQISKWSSFIDSRVYM